MKNMSFLVVEDSNTTRNMIRNALKRIEIEKIFEAKDGEEALKMLKRLKIDFIITDWNMPNVAGLELVNEVRSDNSLKHIPILMITARGKKQDVLQAIDAGVNSYIIKPFNALNLKKKLKDILG